MKRTLVSRFLLFIAFLAAGLVTLLFTDFLVVAGVRSDLLTFFIGRGIIFLIFLVVMAIWFFRFLLPALMHYRKLCIDFREGHIYQEFVQDIGNLSKELGAAVSRMDGLLDRQNSLQLSTKQAEFLALQNQINPHFLYNTLESIRGDALAAGVTSIADITEALSTFFRYTITNTKDLVTMQEEFTNVENYFVIQKYRFGEKLSLTSELADNDRSLLRLQCPKLLLQPLVENAIFHGLERKAEDGHILIRIERIDHDISVSVSDNGVGIPEEKLIALNNNLSRVSVGIVVENEKNHRGGIALYNVCRRIKLLFGEKYGIRIHSIAGIGTRVEAILPAVFKGPSQ